MQACILKHMYYASLYFETLYYACLHCARLYYKTCIFEHCIVQGCIMEHATCNTKPHAMSQQHGVAYLHLYLLYILNLLFL